MRRFHLFEFGDQPWLPRALRDDLTALLRHQLGDVYLPVVPLLAWWLARCRCTRVVDLASGSGGPWPRLQQALAAQGVDVEVVLTDLHPPREGASPLRYHSDPVDARAVPEGLDGCRTLFTAFHHLRPVDASAFLRDAAERRVPLAVFEFTERRRRNALGMLLAPLLVWAQTPSIRPRTWGRLARTYLLPLAPLVYAWDGLVSHLRTYTPDELRAMTGDVGRDGYRWEVGQAPQRGYTITYALGYPV